MKYNPYMMIVALCSLPIVPMRVILAQEIDLDNFINDTTSTDVSNLSAAINSGLNAGVIQSVQGYNKAGLSLSFNSIWVNVSEDQKFGPLADTDGFQIPFAQMEVGLPFKLAVLGRGMFFRMGEQQKESALLWGVGLRYIMLEEAQSVGIGLVAMYEELNQLDDFDIQTLLFQAYFGYRFSGLHLYMAPSATRSLLNIHLKERQNNRNGFENTTISTYLKVVGGLHYYLLDQLALTSTLMLGDYTTISFGANLILF